MGAGPAPILRASKSNCGNATSLWWDRWAKFEMSFATSSTDT